EIKLEDKVFIEFILNQTIKPLLIGFGYALTDCKLRFNQSEKLSLEKRIAVDEVVATQVNIPHEYWYEAYSIPMPKDGNFEPKFQKQPEISGNPQKPTEKKKTNLSELYADLCCQLNDFELDETDDAEFATIVEAITSALFVGTLTLDNFTPSINYKRLTEKIFTKLWAGVEEGYGKTLVGLEVGSPDYVFLSELRKSQAIFAAHKSYKLIETLNSLLIQEWDTITKADFIRKAMVLNTQWNKHWFEAEYRTAIQSAISARQWKEIQRDKDLFPFLQYKTVQDGNVRPEHAVLHNVTRAVDDKFWLTYFPPNGWSCRCNVLKQGSWITPTPDTVLKDAVQSANIPEVFRNNVGVTGRIFADSHPYYDVSDEIRKKCKGFSEKL
ncbi:MAG: phage minor head protein, partial [Planktothrix sp.]